MNRALIRSLGRQNYLPVWQAMKTLTEQRSPGADDEFWLLEHHPVYTLGLNGKPEHILDAGQIPVVNCDRGGQVTYHGPGQSVLYCLVDLKRRQLGVRDLVTALEQSVIALLADIDIDAHARPDAPGVYVGPDKIASLGLRVRRGCSYHGVSVNVAMDLEPFSRINPCGYTGLKMIQLTDLGLEQSPADINRQLLQILTVRLGYSEFTFVDELPQLQESVHA